MTDIMLVTTTMTYANKAKEVLKKYGIESEIRRASGGTAAGCLFGVVMSGNNRRRAEQILAGEDIRIVSVKEVPA